VLHFGSNAAEFRVLAVLALAADGLSGMNLRIEEQPRRADTFLQVI
jgi:hypothetical protein